MRAVNLDTYGLSLLTAKEDIVNPRCSTNWALFRYDGITSNLRLSDSGVGGLAELVQKFHPNWPFYGLFQVGTDGPGHPHVVLIAWVGEGVDEYHRTECANHLPAIKEFFKEADVCVRAKTLGDVTEERINAMLSKTDTSASNAKLDSCFVEKSESVGTNYKRTIAAMEIRRLKRESFWACSEREEEERKKEERRRAADERRCWEKERIQQELREAEERERKMEEKEQRLQEQRRLQAKMEEEARKQELVRWEQQQREQEEDTRTGLAQGQYVDQAAEAAALVSRRSANPREFFRQLSSSSTGQPAPTHLGRPPFRHSSRSLTKSAFIFGRVADPQSPTLEPGITPVPPSQEQDIRNTRPQCITPPASPPASTQPPSEALPVSVPQLEQFPPLHNAGGPEPVSPSQISAAGPDAAHLCARHSPEDAPSAEEDALPPPGNPDVTKPLDALYPKDPVVTQMGSAMDLDSVLKEQPTFAYLSALPLTDSSTPQVMDTDLNIIRVAEEKDHDNQEEDGEDGSSVVDVKACYANQIPVGRTEAGSASVMEEAVSVLAVSLDGSRSAPATEMEDKEEEEVEKESTVTLDLVSEDARCYQENTDSKQSVEVSDEASIEEGALQRFESLACAPDQSGKPSVLGHVEMEETPVTISNPSHGSDTGGTFLVNIDQPTAQVSTSESKIWMGDGLKSEAASNGFLMDNDRSEQIYESRKDGQHSDLMSSSMETDETVEDYLSEEDKGVRAENGEEVSSAAILNGDHRLKGGKLY